MSGFGIWAHVAVPVVDTKQGCSVGGRSGLHGEHGACTGAGWSPGALGLPQQAPPQAFQMQDCSSPSY